jgi:hypothetical protein
VEIGYAKGGDPSYAIPVHEDVEVAHEPPTSAKFLEGPINEDWGNITLRIAQGMKTMSGIT